MVQLDAAGNTSLSCDVRDLNESLKIPVSSSKRRHRKFIVGGMAEKLQQLLQRENSEIAFWEHQVASLKKDDKSVCVIVT